MRIRNAFSSNLALTGRDSRKEFTFQSRGRGCLRNRLGHECQGLRNLGKSPVALWTAAR